MAILNFLFKSCVGFLLLTVIRAEGGSDGAAADDSLISQLLDRVQALEERDSVQQKLIADLRNELTQRDTLHEKAIADLQKEVTNHKKEIGVMKRSAKVKDRRIWKALRILRQTTNKRCVQASEMPKGYAEGKTYESQEPSIVRNRRLENEVPVAFSAGLSKTVPHPGVNQNIVFDHVEINLGNGYNPHHGVFVAPVSGTYVFFTTIYASHAYTDHIFCHFVVNGVAKSTVYAESTSSSSDTSSQMIITQLKQGDDVAIQLLDIVTGIYSNDKLFSTFSGFLLQQDFSQSSSVVG